MLWNIFRQIPDVVAYYEPLHEKLPQWMASRVPPQASHPHIDCYFQDYPPVEDLKQHHLAEFGLCRLYLESDESYPPLKNYIQYLIDCRPVGRLPVLQFNRVDFRLAWLKAHFPETPIIHLYRSPRDQWYSSIADSPEALDENPDADPYLITSWARDLCRQFPFLARPYIRHAYQRFYFLWKLSFLVGSRLADLSVAYEAILQQADFIIPQLLRIGHLEVQKNLETCKSVILKRPFERWKHYRSEEWFTGLEQECNEILKKTGLEEDLGKKPLARIIAENRDYQIFSADPAVYTWAIQSSQSAGIQHQIISEEKEQIIQGHEQLIQAKEQVIQGHEQLIQAKEQVIQGHEQLIQAKEQIIQGHEQLIQAKEQIIQGHEQLIQAKEQIIQGHEQLIQAKEQIIQGQEHAIQDMQRHPVRLLARRYLPSGLKEFIRQKRQVFQPRLGQLEQYAPRSFDSSQCDSAPQSSTQGAGLTIALVTPSFNQAGFIEATIKSVLDQQYPELDYIIQDGGSSDTTPEILMQYRSQLSHVESCRDRGQANAINQGFRHSSAELMAWLNSDDLLLPGALAYVARFFQDHPDVDVVYGHRVLINEDGQEVGRWVLPPHDNAMLLWADYVPQETLFWRRSIWEQSGGCLDESFHFALDWDLLLRFSEAGAKFVRLPRFLGAFRVHAQQKTSQELQGQGARECTRLRRRIHGRDISDQEALYQLRAYFRKHLMYDWLYRLGILQF